MADREDLAALALRLEGILAERQDLMGQVERMLRGEGADDLRTRLAGLRREQERVLAELVALLPPEEPDAKTRA